MVEEIFDADGTTDAMLALREKMDGLTSESLSKLLESTFEDGEGNISDEKYVPLMEAFIGEYSILMKQAINMLINNLPIFLAHKFCFNMSLKVPKDWKGLKLPELYVGGDKGSYE